jgi:hypothetical protein
MFKKHFTFLVLTTLAMAVCICSSAFAADEQMKVDLSSQRDSAVRSLLLAAGMYGPDLQDGPTTDLSFSRSKNLLKGLQTDQGRLDSNNITLSYSGSSGRLGFSAGYIYTSLQENQEPESILLGLDSINQNLLAGNNPWYLALDLSKSFQVSDNISMGVGSRAMLMKTPFDDHDGRVLSMLMNLPMSYKNYFTITPELQWSRTMPDAANTNHSTAYSTRRNRADDKDVFYGGMSISFSY